MAEIASLGLSVTSKDVVQATTALNAMTGAAGKAEGAATKLGTASKTLDAGMAALLAEVKAVNASLAGISGTTAATVSAINQLAAASKSAEASIVGAGSGAKSFADKLKPINDNAKLTQSQLLNLTRQGNDLATMWALGAAPMQIFASQAGQIYDAISAERGLAGGLKQVKGSLVEAVAGFAAFAKTPVGIIAGLTAAGAAAVYFATRTDSAVKPLTDAMKAHRAAVQDVADAYGLVGVKSDAAAKASKGVASLNYRRSKAELGFSLRADLAENFTAGGIGEFLSPSRYKDPKSGARLMEVNQDYAAFAVEIDKLRAGAKAGTPDVLSFAEGVARIANGNPTDEALQKHAAKLIEMTKSSADAQRQLNSLALSFDAVRRAASLDRFDEAQKGLNSFLPSRQRSTRQQIEDAYQKERGAAMQVRGIKGDEREELGSGLVTR